MFSVVVRDLNNPKFGERDTVMFEGTLDGARIAAEDVLFDDGKFACEANDLAHNMPINSPVECLSGNRALIITDLEL